MMKFRKFLSLLVVLAVVMPVIVAGAPIGGVTIQAKADSPAVSENPQPDSIITAIEILRHADNIQIIGAERLSLYDFNGDNIVDTKDAVYMLRVCGGLKNVNITTDIPNYPITKRDIMPNGTHVYTIAAPTMESKREMSNVFVISTVDQFDAFIDVMGGYYPYGNFKSKEDLFQERAIIVIPVSYLSSSFNMNTLFLRKLNEEICMGVEAYPPADKVVTDDANYRYKFICVQKTDIPNVTQFSYCQIFVSHKPEFSIDCFSVKIKPEYTSEDKVWGPEDFPDVDIMKIIRTFSSDKRDSFSVYLNYPGEENILNAIEQMKKYEVVEYVSLAYFTYPA